MTHATTASPPVARGTPVQLDADWHTHVMDRMSTISPSAWDDEVARRFLHTNFKSNVPATPFRFRWGLMDWTLDDYLERIGPDTLVEYQDWRLSDPHYEINSYSHKKEGTFGEFLGKMTTRGNDVYLTAQNTAKNSGALDRVFNAIGELPSFLNPVPNAGFFWMGCDTRTPLHHDETNNIMLQVMGEKLVRLFSPELRDRLGVSAGVHSARSWITDDDIRDLGLGWGTHLDVVLRPGESLFLPIGWWHCVQAMGVSVTMTYNNFVWNNFFGRVGELIH